MEPLGEEVGPIREAFHQALPRRVPVLRRCHDRVGGVHHADPGLPYLLHQAVLTQLLHRPFDVVFGPVGEGGGPVDPEFGERRVREQRQ